MPALSPEASNLLQAIKRAVKPSEADSERVLETLRARLGNSYGDATTTSNATSATAHRTSDVIEQELRPRQSSAIGET